MFDFHTHILPEIDDGSQSPDESLSMIRELQMQGCTGIAATPHFYAMSTSPEAFFRHRREAFERIRNRLPEDAPEIRLGAEVQYFEGILHSDCITDFCLEGTDLLLLEMPFCPWTSRMVSAVLNLNRHAGCRVVLAHIERYRSGGNIRAWKQMVSEGILIQSNAGFFIREGRSAVRWLRKDMIHLIGTDTHNMHSRKPDMKAALDIIGHEKHGALLERLKENEVRALYSGNM